MPSLVPKSLLAKQEIADWLNFADKARFTLRFSCIAKQIFALKGCANLVYAVEAQ
jgi:hypothetical protein